jgi:hypothetical protein
MVARIDLTGQRFGRLVAMEPSQHRTPRGRFKILWTCRCDCGGEAIATVDRLRSGETQSCGCLQRERAAAAHFVHGGKGTDEYLIWKGMRQRCLNPRNPNFRSYGGRGITICERWQASFAAFLADMGPRPSPQHSIDRVNNDGNYEPGNCRWALRVQQLNNHRRSHRITFNGETHTVAEWARLVNIPVNHLAARLGRLGWSPDRALITPVFSREETARLGSTMRWKRQREKETTSS